MWEIGQRAGALPGRTFYPKPYFFTVKISRDKAATDKFRTLWGVAKRADVPPAGFLRDQFYLRRPGKGGEEGHLVLSKSAPRPTASEVGERAKSPEMLGAAEAIPLKLL